MKHCYRLLSVIVLSLVAATVWAEDPGLPDTVRIESRPVPVGVSTPIGISIFNDSAVTDLNMVFLLSSQDSGFVQFDSAVFCGRFADPSILPFRIINTRMIDGKSPDTLLIACLRNALNSLPPGDDTVVELFFTGLAPGRVKIDSVSTKYNISVAFVAPGAREYCPVFSGVSIEVLEAAVPPEFSPLNSDQPVTAITGERINLAITAASPGGGPVNLSLSAFTDTDNRSREPLSPPEFDVGGFEWAPFGADVGIWTATFEAIDSIGLKSTATVEIQIVSDDAFLVELAPTPTPATPLTTGLHHGDTDNDGLPELMLACNPTGSGLSLAVYDYLGAGELQRVFAVEDDLLDRGLVPVFLGADDYLDAVVCHAGRLRLLLGRGNNSFRVVDNQPSAPPLMRDGTLIDYDGNACLDYACVAFDRVVIFRGGTDFRFTEALSFAPGDTGLSINSADFDGDGWDDLAVGTTAGLEVYLSDGMGGYALRESHAQTFGAVDLQVTYDGSDFDDDGIYDLCLASPSVGGEYSELMLYLGRPDGTFDQKLVRRVRGQIFANRAGDLNGDGHPDIAYINGARAYLGILFGDGEGRFPDELRYPVSEYKPRQMDCLDIDLDGDLDVVVSSYLISFDDESSLFVFENQLNPAEVRPASLEIRACNNADPALQAPAGGRLNRITNSMASADFYRRDLDHDDYLDVVAVTNTLESGRYDLLVLPRKNLAPGESFSLEYDVDGRPFRIARNLPVPENGYLFPMYPGGNSPLSPRQGEFIQTSLPTFTWESGGVERFELAADINFSRILESAMVTDGVYTLQMVLPETDSTAYFWRLSSGVETNPNRVHVFNVVRCPTDVDDPDGPVSLPDSCWLAQNYPNPFNPHTTVQYHLSEGGPVSITIHNVLGQLIKILEQRSMPAGTHSSDWDATDLYDQPVASGIYFYRMESREFSSTRKMVLVR